MKVRRFVEGEDEAAWLRVRNEAYREYDDVRPKTMEDIELSKKGPRFDATGMFIAELDGKPVGVVNAFVDKRRTERVGFLGALGSFPSSEEEG